VESTHMGFAFKGIGVRGRRPRVPSRLIKSHATGGGMSGCGPLVAGSHSKNALQKDRQYARRLPGVPFKSRKSSWHGGQENCGKGIMHADAKTAERSKTGHLTVVVGGPSTS